MTPERWQRIKPLLHSALEREPSERSAFLAAECAGDEALRQEVESLIASHDQAGEFIESPAFEVMAGSLDDNQVVGRNLGPYAISARLGAGGMGEVYLAEDTRLGRKVALKMLPASLTTVDERVRRFQQEARAASALNHPNIITIYEIGEMDSRHFMATEFIEGETLFDRLKAGLMNISDALDISVQVTSALCAAHHAGIVHRDIKPGNIMLRTDGIVKVLDFGLATLTEQKSDDLEAATLVKTKPGIVMGTAHYMSPEQARGQKMDARTDIFSLGVVLYEMLTGHLPFAGQTMTDVLASILMLEPPSLSQSAPEAPEELQRIVHSTLRKDKEERYQTSGELLIDLKALKQELEFETRRGGLSSGSGASAVVAANVRPETRYARSGDVNIAYQVLGDGPIDLVYVPGWVTNIDYSWEDPSLARYYRRLASFSRLILFDKRGTGLSDQTAKLPTLEQRMDDVRAVMDAVGSERAALFGASEGGPMCVLFAATYPERTSALIAYGIFAKRIWDPEYPWAPRPEERQKWYDRIEQEWGGVIDLLTLAPSVANDERFKQWWASFLRLSASPGAALALSRTNTQIDVRHILPAIRVPTLVLHRTDDMEVNVEEGRFIGERIAGAKFVELPGVDHLPWVGDQNAIVDKVEEFLRDIQHMPELDRVLATVLFTQTLGPTAGAARLKPHQWQELLERHYQLVRKDLEQFRGHEIETTENRLLATFDGPARAIRAACAVNDSARLMGIAIKAGLHTGECDVIGDKVGGVAVEIGAQVAAKATSGEILVSSTVKDLVAGSDIQFEDRGAHALKGVAEKWRLFAVKQDNDSSPVTKALTASKTKGRRRGKAIDSLAVLPLINDSPDPNMEYFSDGVTESIINALSQLPKLRVVARGTVFRYKGQEVDPQEVGQELGVRAVLTGRVRQAGDELMIAAELIDVTNDSQLWGEHYSRELSDIFVVQEEIAKEISEKLRLKLTGEEKKRLAKRHTENTEAYKLYLKGLYYWNKRTAECLKKGIEYFEQAIEMDPNYALAYTGLADSYVLLGRYEALSPKESFPRAKAAAMKALQIDPGLAEAFPSLASARFKYDWDWAGAETDFKHGIELNPNCATARHWYGHYLWCRGRFDEAVKQTQEALQLDPLSLMIDVSSTTPYLYARQYDQVIENCRRILDLHPNFPPAHTHLGWAYEQTGQLPEAIAEFQKACLLDDNPENLASLGHAYAKAGNIEEARGRIEKLQEISRKRYASPYGIALIHIGLGEKDQALRWLEKAYKERSYWLVHLKVDPRFDGLRSDPRFTDLVQRIGLSTAEHHTTKELPGDPTSASIPPDQEIRFCTTSDGVRIAYATVGQGPPLLKAANWLNHLEFDWHSPIWNHLIQEFARDHFLVRYDERGNGLSDWKVENFTFEAFVQDLASVVDSVGMDRFPILGISQGGPVAIAYAVRYPERVSQLILYGCYARGWAKRGTPEVSERWEVQKSLIKLGWGQDNPAFRQLWSSLYIPDATPEQWQWFNDLHRICTSPENAFRLLDELGKIDVVDLLKQVKVPTLVLHCRDDFVVPFEEGRRLAGLIPGARFVPLEGRNHLLLESEPAWPKFVTEVRRFLETEQFEAGSEWAPKNSPLADSIERKTSGQHSTVPTASDQAPTGEIKLAAVSSSAGEIARVPVKSSAEYVVGGIKRHKTAVAAIAAIVVLLIAGLVYSYFTGRGRTIDSLAVLPFLNATGDPNSEYLSDGIAESIIYSTSKLPDLKVMPRSSVFRYKGKEIDTQTVGRELGVSAVLTGRVIQRGDDLTISAELIDLRENRVLWGQHYTRKIGDILAVQEEIAREISEKLRLRLTTEDKKQLAKKYTENAEAYQLYLKGRYYWYKRTRDGYKKAIEHFDQAIQKDPSYALAYTGLADSYNVLSSYGIASPKESFPKGREAALRAREIDASLAEARTSLAYVKYQYDWDFSGAESGFKESIELNPNYATAHQWYALELAVMGRMDEAVRQITRAQEIDPTALIVNVNAGWIFYHARQYDRAVEQMRKSLEMDPNFARGHWAISEPLEQMQRYEEAIAELQKARQLDETPIMLALLGHVYAVTGRRNEAQKIIGELNEQSKRMYVDPYFVAQIHTALGDRDKAFEELEKAFEERSSWLVWLKVEPKFDSLHSDPRFTNLVQRIGLP